MATNNRVYYPIHLLAFGKYGVDYTITPTGFMVAHGVQSVGHNVSFNLEQVFEIGQIDLYENIEDIPNVELTAEKVIDGYPLLQHLGSQTPGAGNSTLSARYNDARCQVLAAIYPQSHNAASGTPLSMIHMSGMYVSSIGFSIPIQGNITESCTFVGNDRVWRTGSIPTGLYASGTHMNNADSPPGTGGVQRRENVIMANSLWPTQIPGISPAGLNAATNGVYAAHIQNVNISVNLGRTELYELGTRAPYYRYAEFPTEVTCSIEITSSDTGDAINASSTSDNLVNEPIKVALSCGVTIDLGTKNKLSNVTENGGDASGGNKTTTYNYSNFNFLTVTFPSKDFLS